MNKTTKELKEELEAINLELKVAMIAANKIALREYEEANNE